MSESNSLTHAGIMAFEVAVIITASLKIYVENMESHLLDLKALWQCGEEMWSVLMTEGADFTSWKDIGKGWKWVAIVEWYS